MATLTAPAEPVTTVDLSLLLDVIVRGLPAPQGSKRHVGRGILVESSKRVKPWRDAVRSTVADAWPHDSFDGPVIVELTFAFPRPAGHYGTGRNAGTLKASAPLRPAGLPDVDKLARSTLDGIVAAGVLRDDARVVDLHARKRYCWHPVLPQPGARILIRQVS